MPLGLTQSGRTCPERHRDRRTGAAMAVLVIVAVGPFVQDMTAQPAARFALTAAVWDHGTVGLERYEHVLGVDRVQRPEGLYSDKAPGQPFLALPAYALYRAAGGEQASQRRVSGNLGLWLMTLWSAVLPAAALGLLMWRWVSRLGLPHAVPATVSILFGTLLLPFSTQLYGHMLAATLGFAGYLLVSSGPDRGPPARLAMAGLLAGASVAVEYPMAILVLVLIVLVVVDVAARAGWFLLGLVPGGVLTAMYHWAAFGHPLRTPYSLKGGALDEGLTGVTAPSVVMAGRALGGERGILVLTPVVLVALVGAVLMLRAPDLRRAGVVSLAVFAAFLLLPAGWDNPWGGEMPGPRYLIPALPFLAAPLAFMWQRAPRVAALAAVVGLAIMLLPTVTFHLVPDGTHPLVAWRSYLQGGRTATTLFTMLLGGAGWLVHATAVALAGGALWRSCR